MSDPLVPTGRLNRAARMVLAGAHLGAHAVLERTSPDILHNAVSNLGQMRGLATKVGQMMSYVDGFAPEEHQAALENAMSMLRASAARSPISQVRATVERDLGVTINDAFLEWDDTPLASASIGQVHRARLHDGMAVAVKVQHPGIRKAVEADLTNATSFDVMLGLLVGGKHHARELLTEARQRFFEELDYELEAERQKTFRAIHSLDPLIQVPHVIRTHSSKHVLTSELVEGVALENAVLAPYETRKRWAETLWRFVFRGNLVHGMFNADPHPGNFLFQEDGKVAFLDFGCVQCSEPSAHLQAVQTHLAAIQGDEDKLRNVTIELIGARPGPHSDMVVAFMRACLAPIMSSPYRIERSYVAGLVKQLKASAMAANKLPREAFAPLPKGILFMNRLQFGFYSVLARLGVSVDYAGVEQDFLEQALVSAQGRCSSVRGSPED